MSFCKFHPACKLLYPAQLFYPIDRIPCVTKQTHSPLLAHKRMVNMTKQHALERQNGMIAGVCGGIAAYTGMSVFLVRLIFFLLLIPGGLPGLVPYLVLWLVMPKAKY